MQSLAFSPQELYTVLDTTPFSPHQLLDLLVRQYPNIYNQKVASFEKYTLRQHTFMVMSQFEKYFAHLPLPGKIDTKYFRLFLAMHDIGKPDAIAKGNKYLQHQFNAEYVYQLFSFLQIDEKHTKLAVALASGDPIGEFLREKKTGAQTRKRIHQKAQEVSLPYKDFFRIQCVFYKVDASSYTRNAGGPASLDKYFKFDEKNRRLLFSKKTAKKMSVLGFD